MKAMEVIEALEAKGVKWVKVAIIHFYLSVLIIGVLIKIDLHLVKF